MVAQLTLKIVLMATVLTAGAVGFVCYLRPGMTGLRQVSGRSQLSWRESVRLDLYYVDNWSMMGDLVILAKTFRVVMWPQGSY